MDKPRRISELFLSATSFAEIKGWVRTRRDTKAGLSFIAVNDGSMTTPFQVVALNTLPNYESEIKQLTAGCAVVVRGHLVQSIGKGQTLELRATEIEVIGWVEDPETYPIQSKTHTFEYLREVAHLRPRTNVIGAMARVRATASQAIHRYFHDEGFCWVHTPIITGSDCEGAGEMFRVSSLDFTNIPKTKDGKADFSQDFFGKPVHLTVSGQLNAEAYALALGKVYTFGPTFRAEQSNTRRHMAEFWMVEPEVAFADLESNMKLAEDFLKYVCFAVLVERRDEMNFFKQTIDNGCVERVEKMVAQTFTRMTYTEAIKLLEKSGKKFEYPVFWGVDLHSEHERYIAEEIVKNPVILTDYPKDIKAFYMRMNTDEKTVAAMDIILPGIGEVIGGSQREERLEFLDRRMDAMGLSKKDYSWYRDLRRYGTVPHAGFGLGLERLLMYITGIDNIRDTIPFPRTPGQASF